MLWCHTPSPEFWVFIKGCHAQGRCQSDLSLLLLLYPCARRSSGSTAWHWGSGHPRLPESHRAGSVFWRCLPLVEKEASLHPNVPSSCPQGTVRPFVLWEKETKWRQSVPTSAEEHYGGPWPHPVIIDRTQSWKTSGGWWMLTSNSVLAGVESWFRNGPPSLGLLLRLCKPRCHSLDPLPLPIFSWRRELEAKSKNHHQKDGLKWQQFTGNQSEETNSNSNKINNKKKSESHTNCSPWARAAPAGQGVPFLPFPPNPMCSGIE